MLRKELFPRCLPTPFRSRLDPMALQDFSNGAGGKVVSQVG